MKIDLRKAKQTKKYIPIGSEVENKLNGKTYTVESINMLGQIKMTNGELYNRNSFSPFYEYEYEHEDKKS